MSSRGDDREDSMLDRMEHIAEVEEEMDDDEEDDEDDSLDPGVVFGSRGSSVETGEDGDEGSSYAGDEEEVDDDEEEDVVSEEESDAATPLEYDWNPTEMSIEGGSTNFQMSAITLEGASIQCCSTHYQKRVLTILLSPVVGVHSPRHGACPIPAFHSRLLNRRITLLPLFRQVLPPSEDSCCLGRVRVICRKENSTTNELSESLVVEPCRGADNPLPSNPAALLLPEVPRTRTTIPPRRQTVAEIGSCANRRAAYH